MNGVEPMMKKYDALYIFVNAPKDEGLDNLIEKVGAEITRLGGELVGSETLGKRNFARPMRKRDSGVYIRIRFAIEPDKIAALRARYAIMEEVFRVQILSVDERREQLVIDQAARRKAKAEAAAADAEEAAADADDDDSDDDR
ncbi:MAG: 30S ribosomal protein S6 [Lentisphaerae bacterium]|jgi:ribosomal protein S6|nr:30S ribosomal protein S6 [Lentisphaerota bacterium]